MAINFCETQYSENKQNYFIINSIKKSILVDVEYQIAIHPFIHIQFSKLFLTVIIVYQYQQT